jgi:hypothetical protein
LRCGLRIGLVEPRHLDVSAYYSVVGFFQRELQAGRKISALLYERPLLRNCNAYAYRLIGERSADEWCPKRESALY